MEEKNKHIRYYILFDNHTQGMMLHELLDKQGLPNRIAPAPRDTDGKAACGMALLIHPDDIDAVRTCIEENHGVIGQNVLMANPSHQTFYPHYVSRSKQLHHPRLKDSFPIDSSHSFADK